MNQVKIIKDKKIIVKNLRIEKEVDEKINDLKYELEKLNKVNVSQNDVMKIAMKIGLEQMSKHKEKYNSYELTKEKSNFIIDEKKLIDLFEYLQNNTVKSTKEKFKLNRNEYNNYINRLKLLNAVKFAGALKKAEFLITTEELRQILKN